MKKKKTIEIEIDLCPLFGGDYIVSVNLLYTKEKLNELGIKTENDIINHITNKLDQENSNNE
tara:strand:- start:633 stop:818 length:186 start_codon:yes stop_codon:yes gene_type:complete